MSVTLERTVASLKSLEEALDHVEINHARQLTKEHEPKTVIKPWHNYVGKAIAILFSLGCGVTGAAALAAAGIFTGPALLGMMLLLGFSSTYANYLMTRVDLPKIVSLGTKIFKTEGPQLTLEEISLDDTMSAADEKAYFEALRKTIAFLFQKQNVDLDETDIVITKKKKGNKSFFNVSFTIPETHKGVSIALLHHLKNHLGAKHAHHEPAKNVSLIQRIALGVATVFALGFGFAIGALTYTSFYSIILLKLFLGVALPWIAIPIAIVSFLCLSAVMIKTFADVIKTTNLAEKIAKLVERKENESTFMYGLRVGLITTLGGGVLALAAYGIFNTLTGAALSVNKVFAYALGFSGPAAVVLSGVISQGIAFVAQAPFMIKTCVGTIANAINAIMTPRVTLKHAIAKVEAKTTELKAEQSTQTLLTQAAISGLRIVAGILHVGFFCCNAVSNGFLSIHGQPITVTTTIAGIGGTLNSFFSTFGNWLANSAKKPMGAEAVVTTTNVSSTATMAKVISIERKLGDTRRIVSPSPVSDTRKIENSFSQSFTATFDNNEVKDNEFSSQRRVGSP